MTTQEVQLYALCKKYAKNYCDTHASTLTEEQAVQAVANYFNENPRAIVTNDELELILEDYLTEHQDISGKVDKPTEPVAGQGINVPYYFDVTYDADKATVRDYTVDLLNKDKEPGVYSLNISAATAEKAGLMSAADKTALAGKQDAIADLADIRAGAAAGATALQEHQDISGKQDNLIASDNIVIADDGKTISAINTKYTVTIDI